MNIRQTQCSFYTEFFFFEIHSYLYRLKLWYSNIVSDYRLFYLAHYQDQMRSDLMIKNPYQREVRKSFLLMIRCGQCKEDFALYQKVGRGNVLRMYVPRIIECVIDLTSLPGRLYCPNCGQHIADLIELKESGKIAYRMERSSFNTQEIHQ